MITVDELFEIHKIVAEKSSIKISLRKPDMLSSIVELPFLKIQGNPVYNNHYEKAACLMQEIIRRHPFTDGNKRTALLAACSYLKINGINVNINIEDVNMFPNIASNPDKDHVKQISEWFSSM